MGCGSWTRDSYVSYSTTKGMNVSTDGMISGSYSNQDMFKARNIDSALDPKNVIRECCDTEEHPNTIPVILALDVTGSMNDVSVEIAKKLNVIMTKLYEDITDVEFMIMGIGDLAYDNSPIQISQFESDIRIAEQLDKLWFENGGGGNDYESYTAAWYMGSRHTKIDCNKRYKKGIIITIGDERLNPYLPKNELEYITGDKLQGDIETKELYHETSNKFNIYHLDVDHRCHYDADNIKSSFMNYLDENHFKVVNLNNVVDEIITIIKNESTNGIVHNEDSNGITW